MIMITAWYLPTKSTEVGMKFLEISKKIPYEDYEEPIIFGASKSVRNGMRIISIVKIKRKEEKELNDRIFY